MLSSPLLIRLFSYMLPCSTTLLPWCFRIPAILYILCYFQWLCHKAENSLNLFFHRCLTPTSMSGTIFAWNVLVKWISLQYVIHQLMVTWFWRSYQVLLNSVSSSTKWEKNSYPLNISLYIEYTGQAMHSISVTGLCHYYISQSTIIIYNQEYQ